MEIPNLNLMGLSAKYTLFSNVKEASFFMWFIKCCMLGSIYYIKDNAQLILSDQEIVSEFRETKSALLD